MLEREAKPLTSLSIRRSRCRGRSLVERGALLAEVTWRSRQNHSRQLLPALDWLLARARPQSRDRRYVRLPRPGFLRRHARRREYGEGARIRLEMPPSLASGGSRPTPSRPLGMTVGESWPSRRRDAPSWPGRRYRTEQRCEELIAPSSCHPRDVHRLSPQTTPSAELTRCADEFGRAAESGVSLGRAASSRSPGRAGAGTSAVDSTMPEASCHCTCARRPSVRSGRDRNGPGAALLCRS